ncbi:hypothetical protein BpHYR1_005414 [Brachionus plicatilis]|uniref:Uncharacterized protein n=1 Tax=Brachionus plicatilis TaxID=10195 RepID=A0A3M7Q9Y9_BRAPC|nr:hypothetical protein BpHYR1_005414 [Brachionus plicatilis]
MHDPLLDLTVDLLFDRIAPSERYRPQWLPLWCHRWVHLYVNLPPLDATHLATKQIWKPRFDRLDSLLDWLTQIRSDLFLADSAHLARLVHELNGVQIQCRAIAQQTICATLDHHKSSCHLRLTTPDPAHKLAQYRQGLLCSVSIEPAVAALELGLVGHRLVCPLVDDVDRRSCVNQKIHSRAAHLHTHSRSIVVAISIANRADLPIATGPVTYKLVVLLLVDLILVHIHGQLSDLAPASTAPRLELLHACSLLTASHRILASTCAPAYLREVTPDAAFPAFRVQRGTL